MNHQGIRLVELFLLLVLLAAIRGLYALCIHAYL